MNDLIHNCPQGIQLGLMNSEYARVIQELHKEVDDLEDEVRRLKDGVVRILNIATEDGPLAIEDIVDECHGLLK